MIPEFPPVHLWFPGVVAMFCLILVSAFFSGSETALFYLSQDELRSMRVGTFRERAAAQLIRQPDRLLTAILFWNLFVNLAYFATSVVVAERLIHAGYRATAGLFGLVGLFTIILFGEVVPKSVSVVFRRSVASLVGLPLAIATRVLDPVIPALARLTLVARRTFWPHLTREPFLEADDLERAVEVSEHSPDVVEHERQALHSVLELSEIPAEEIMRPRGTYVALAPPIHLADLRKETPESGYIIVLNPENEEIEQAIPVNEFSEIPEKNLEQAAEDVVYVPWCANLADVLQQLRNRFCGVAAIVNEYGETMGIVTYEDLVDTAIIPQASRAKRILQREPVLEVSPGKYHVEGMTTLRYLCRRLGLEFEPSSEGVITVAGLLHEGLEDLPQVGDECTWRGYSIRVIEADQTKRLRTLVTKLEGSEDPDAGIEVRESTGNEE